jgi:hypothetical protein
VTVQSVEIGLSGERAAHLILTIPYWAHPDRVQTLLSGWSSVPISVTAHCRLVLPKRR